MRNYYSSDKKRREDAKRKKNEEKRLKRLNKNVPAGQAPAGEAGIPESMEEAKSANESDSDVMPPSNGNATR